MAKEMTPDELVGMVQGISRAMKTLSAGKLKQEVIVTLIHDKTKISKRDIKLVLENLSSLESIWLKK